MIIGHVHSTKVKHFVATKLLRNAAKVSSTVTYDTEEVPDLQQHETPRKGRRHDATPDYAALLDPTTDGPLPRVTSDLRCLIKAC